jgi:hypothetical protein
MSSPVSDQPTMAELYPEGGPDYHDAHEAYIAVVVAALEAGGVEVLDSYADANDPRDGAIQVRPSGALNSLISDLNKHPGTAKFLYTELLRLAVAHRQRMATPHATAVHRAYANKQRRNR